MADNVTLNAMTGGATVAADEVTDGTLGTVKVQYVKLMDGTLDGTTKASVDSSFGLKVDVARTVNVVLAAGSNVIGGVTQSGTWNVGLSAGSNAIGTTKRTHQPTPYKLISAATTNATNVSSTANTLLYGYYISNSNGSAWRYVKFYNKASAPTVGTDTPVLVLGIPPNGAANASFPAGVNFSTGLSFATTVGVADADTAAVNASELVVNLAYAVY